MTRYQLLIDGKAVIDLTSWDLHVLSGLIDTELAGHPSYAIQCGRFELQSYQNEQRTS